MFTVTIKKICLKHAPSYLKGCNVRIYHECEGGKEISVLMITVWHHKPSRMMANGDPE